MSAAKTTGATQYLGFKIGAPVFALELGKVREILDSSAMTTVPRMPQFMRGLISLRGRVTPVVDLRLKFGLPGTEKTANTSVIIAAVNRGDDTTELGVLTDLVLEVIDLGPDKLDPAPMEGPAIYHDFIQGTKKQGDILYSVLDLDKLFSAEELSRVFAICAGVTAETTSRTSHHQDTPGKAIAGLNTMITKANTFDDLLKVLDVMAKEIVRITSTKRVRAEEIQCMASYLTAIRLLLNEQERYVTGVKETGRKMSGRYMALEGMVKEMRNDLDRAIKRVSA